MHTYQVVASGDGRDGVINLARAELVKLLAIRPDEPATTLLVLTSPHFEHFGELMRLLPQVQAVADQLAFGGSAGATVQARSITHTFRHMHSPPDLNSVVTS